MLNNRGNDETLINKHRQGVLNLEAEIFMPRSTSELRDNLKPDEVVEIIKDSRSTNKILDQTTRSEASTSSVIHNTLTIPSAISVEEYNVINAKSVDNLRKETEVKPQKVR